MRRRPLLAFGVTLLTGGLAGCADALDLRSTPDPWADAEPRYPDNRPVRPDASTHHLFVENFDDRSYRAVLTVSRPDAVLVWRATYEAPDGRGFVIRDLLVEGRTYEIALDIDDGERSTTSLSIAPCQDGARAATADGTATPASSGGGSRNVGVWIDGGTVTFQQDGCDELRVGRLPTGSHDSFRLPE